MATKKDIKELLKKLNLSESDMDKYWDELNGINSIVTSLTKSGKTWRDLNTYVIEQLPIQKKKKQDEDYYTEHFEEIMLEKIDAGEKLTEDELSELAYDYGEEREYGENRRWSRSVTSIVKIKDRFFCIEWENGLTGSQPNEFYNQPYEVTKKTYEKTITVTEWVSVK